MSPDPGAPIEPGSIWSLKPWWCQPWSIVLTGVAVLLGSWVLVHRWWITAALAAAVLTWWWLFLVLMPRVFSQQRELPGPDSGQA
jgi:hypothetical protein